jgi:hypothetical protein
VLKDTQVLKEQQGLKEEQLPKGLKGLKVILVLKVLLKVLKVLKVRLGLQDLQVTPEIQGHKVLHHKVPKVVKEPQALKEQ